MASKTSKSSGKSDNSNVLGALAYLFGPISGILLYLISKDSFVRFHAAQSTIWFVLLWVVNMVLMMIPVLGWIAAAVVGLVSLISWLFLMYKAVTGERYSLPTVGEWAEKYS